MRSGDGVNSLKAPARMREDILILPARFLRIMPVPKAKTVAVLDRKALQAKAATKAQRESNNQPNIDKHPECFLPAMRR